MSDDSYKKKILLIRNDKIGDFMLAWPSFALLKKQYPNAEVTALVPEYTADLAQLCRWIDHVLIDKKNDSFIRDVINLKNNIHRLKFDISISLFSQTRTSLALWLAGVELRIGPATKIAQIFLNHRLRQKRSQSAKPEYEYNCDLVKYLIILQGNKPVDTPTPPYLSFDQLLINQLRGQYRSERNIATDSLLIIVHPGTGGSAINLSTEQYATLIKEVSINIKTHFIITAGPGEIENAQSLSILLTETEHSFYQSKDGIVPFSQFIASCDCFISGSTGPLHIAGALNVNTVAFYPARKSATSLRWQTTNLESRRISFSAEKHIDENDMRTIDPVDCAHKIIRFLKENNQ